MDAESPGAGKSLVRAQLRAARRARPPDQRAGVAAALARRALEPGPLARALAEEQREGRAPARVALYDARATEPGTAPLVRALGEVGVVVLLPVVRPDTASAAGPVPSPLGWVEAAGGAPSALDGVLAVLLPALAVDATGTRLGQGGGHYDTTLAAAGWDRPGPGRPLLAALVHEEEVLAAGALEREAHDVGVDAALTPGGWVALPR